MNIRSDANSGPPTDWGGARAEFSTARRETRSPRTLAPVGRPPPRRARPVAPPNPGESPPRPPRPSRGTPPRAGRRPCCEPTRRSRAGRPPRRTTPGRRHPAPGRGSSRAPCACGHRARSVEHASGATLKGMTPDEHPGYDAGTALLVVDVQNDFADPSGSLYVGEGEHVVAVANREIAAASRAGSYVVYSKDWHLPSTP